MRLSTLLAALWCVPAALAAPFQYGDIFVSAANGNVYRYNQSGTLLQTMNAGGTAYGLAFDSAGNLYVATGSAIQKFDNAGAPLGAFTTNFPGALHSANDIDFDDAGNAFVVGIQDLNFDFVRKYSSTGTVLATQAIAQGQENWVYADYAGGNTLLVTPGTTTIVVPVNTTTLALGGTLFIANGGPNGDLEGLPGGGFLMITGNPIDQLNSSRGLMTTYNTTISGTWIGVDSLTPSTFWAVSDFGEVRAFNLGTSAPFTGFATGVNGRGIALYTIPEPSALALGGIGLTFLFATLRRRKLQTASL